MIIEYTHNDREQHKTIKRETSVRSQTGKTKDINKNSRRLIQATKMEAGDLTNRRMLLSSTSEILHAEPPASMNPHQRQNTFPLSIFFKCSPPA